MIRQKSYKFCLYPNLEQRIFFEKTFGCSRFIWNQMLADKITHYKETGESLKNTPAQYKDEFPWLKEVDSLALSNVCLNLNTAYKSFFQSKFGFPNFKSKKTAQSYKTNNQKGTIALLDEKVKLPKVGWVKLKLHRQPKGVIKSATISKTATGKYFISILCEEEILPLPKTDSNLGIDLGLENFAILSTGEKIGNPKFLTSLSKKLAKEQKILSRRGLLAKKKGMKLSESSNYQKQKLKVARLHERLTRIRTDYNRKALLSLVLERKPSSITIENLAVRNLMKNRHLSKAISKAQWYQSRLYLENLCKKLGIELRLANRLYPSSKLCSDCGFKYQNLKLKERFWTCSNCGSEHDRDRNAAINLGRCQTYTVLTAV